MRLTFEQETFHELRKNNPPKNNWFKSKVCRTLEEECERFLEGYGSTEQADYYISKLHQLLFEEISSEHNEK